MKKFKTLTAALLAIVLLITSFAFTSCDKDAFPDISSGEKVDISESNLKVKNDFKTAKEKDGYISDYTIKIDIDGYKEISYFDGGITFTWTYEVLLDDSEGYVEDSYTTTIDFGADGKENFKEQIALENCRSVRNINCELAFYGYAIKK